MPAHDDPGTARETVTYLNQRGYLDVTSLVSDGLTVIDASRRNRVVSVLPTDSPAILLKEGIGHAGARAVAREASIYDLLAEHSGPLGAHVLRRIGFDAEAGVLLLERPPDAHTLHDDQARRGLISRGHAAALGDALGALHTLPAPAREAFPLAPLPWVFTFQHPTLAEWQALSGASRQLVRIVRQSPPFCAALDELSRDWAISGPIHGDVRWSNCVVSGRRKHLYLVDWEFAGLGDPAWDIGCALGECLRAWLQSVPIAGDEPPDRFLHLAGTPLARLHPGIDALWSAWVARTGARDSMLARATRYAGARLVQSAFEAAQGLNHPGGVTVVQMQLALNVLLHPDDAAERLLGIGPPRQMHV